MGLPRSFKVLVMTTNMLAAMFGVLLSHCQEIQRVLSSLDGCSVRG